MNKAEKTYFINLCKITQIEEYVFFKTTLKYIQENMFSHNILNNMNKKT